MTDGRTDRRCTPDLESSFDLSRDGLTLSVSLNDDQLALTRARSTAVLSTPDDIPIERSTDMNTGKRVEVELPALGRNGRVVVEGVDISRACAAVTVDSSPSSATTITLTLQTLALHVRANGQAVLKITPEVASALEALGWTAPSGFNPDKAQAVPGGPEGPVLLTLDELCRSDPHPHGMAAYGPTGA